MSQAIVLEQDELKIKRRWLKITFIRMVVLALFSFLLMALSFLAEAAGVKELSVSGIMFLTSVTFFLILYRCAYLKFGNKFLYFIMGDGCVSLAKLFMTLYKEPFNIWTLSAFIINISVFAVWLYYSEKLKVVNKKYRAQAKAKAL